MNHEANIYFVSNSNGFTRIARTSDLGKRMSEWQRASPTPLQVIGQITTPVSKRILHVWFARPNPAGYGVLTDLSLPKEVPTEYLHGRLMRHFCNYHIHDEWYSLDEDALNSIPLERPLMAGRHVDEVNKAELTWLAVDKAHRKLRAAPGINCTDCGAQKREAFLAEHVIDWLTAYSKNSVDAVLRVNEELRSLKWLAVVSGLNYVPSGKWRPESFDCFLAWLILQGKEAFTMMIENRVFRPIFDCDDEYKAYFVADTLSRIMQKRQHAGYELHC